MVTTQHITTAQQLLQATDLGRCELVRGELITMSLADFEHGRLVTCIASPLSSYVDNHCLGAVTGTGTGFRIGHDPDTVRAPDVGFVRADRVPHETTRDFFPGPPDLAVEVLSPDGRPGKVREKVHHWLDAGCRVVWVADPAARTVALYRANDEVEILSDSDVVSGDDIVPGFTLPVAEIFGRAGNRSEDE